jgi:hypothetical protein
MKGEWLRLGEQREEYIEANETDEDKADDNPQNDPFAVFSCQEHSPNLFDSSWGSDFSGPAVRVCTRGGGARLSLPPLWSKNICVPGSSHSSGLLHKQRPRQMTLYVAKMQG